MRFEASVDEALRMYDREKGILRRIRGDQKCIAAVKTLAPDQRNNFMTVLACFFVNERLEDEQASQKAYMYLICALVRERQAQLKPAVFNEHIQYPWRLANALDLLSSHGLFSPENAELIIADAYPFPTAFNMVILKNEGLLTQEIQNKLLHHKNPLELAKAIRTLHKTDYYSEENIELLARHSQPNLIFGMIISANHHRLLTAEVRANLKLLDSQQMETALEELLKQTSKSFISRHPENLMTESQEEGNRYIENSML